MKHYEGMMGDHHPHFSNLRWVGEFLLCFVGQQICLLIPGEKINFTKVGPPFFIFVSNKKKFWKKNFTKNSIRLFLLFYD